jgi:hypothetical protein
MQPQMFSRVGENHRYLVVNILAERSSSQSRAEIRVGEVELVGGRIMIHSLGLILDLRECLHSERVRLHS